MLLVGIDQVDTREAYLGHYEFEANMATLLPFQACQVVVADTLDVTQ